MSTALIHTITEDSIKLLVDTFYSHIRQDDDLKPLFEDTIGTTDQAWQPHLQLMYDFWSSLMLTSGKYKGNPMQKHQALPKFDAAMFDKWLALFAHTSRSLFVPAVADDFIAKSQRVAESLKLALYYKPPHVIM